MVERVPREGRVMIRVDCNKYLVKGTETIRSGYGVQESTPFSHFFLRREIMKGR